MTLTTSSTIAQTFDNFIVIWANELFSVVSRTGKRIRNRDFQETEDDAVESPLPSPIASTEDPWMGLHRVALVALRSGQMFSVVLASSAAEGKPAVSDEAQSTATSSSTLTLKLQTSVSIGSGMQLRAMLAKEHFDNLEERELIEAIVAQPSDWMSTIVDWRQRRQTLEMISRLYYEGLFTLPHGQNDRFLNLPNGKMRYVIDFCSSADGCWIRDRKVRRAIGRQCTSEAFKEPNAALSSSALRIVVNRNLAETLRAAIRYHCEQRGNGTWLGDNLLKAMELMSVAGNRWGVKLCAIELFDAPTGVLLAGCLGFAVGSVYHDFTMFTAVRCSKSYGTVLTNVIGAALQECGYRLWYWGFRVDYMALYEAHCGAKNMDRAAFYSEWVKYRDELPIWPIDTYLNEGMGLLRGGLGEVKVEDCVTVESKA